MNMPCYGSFRKRERQGFATHLAWFADYSKDVSSILAAAPITGCSMSAIDDAVFSRFVATKC